MNYNYNQTTSQTASPQQLQYNSQPRTYQPTSWNSRIRPVTSIEEARACPIDFDGSIFYFPDMANKRIYTKWINTDGTPGFNMYELKEIPQQNSIGNNYITREEFEEAMNQIRNIIIPQPIKVEPKQEIQENPVLQF